MPIAVPLWMTVTGWILSQRQWCQFDEWWKGVHPGPGSWSRPGCLLCTPAPQGKSSVNIKKGKKPHTYSPNTTCNYSKKITPDAF